MANDMYLQWVIPGENPDYAEFTFDREAIALIIHNRRPKCYEAFGNEDDGCGCIAKADAIIAELGIGSDDE